MVLASPAKRQLRQQMRAQRRALTTRQQRLASLRLARRLRLHPALLRARRIGLYLPNEGEIDPRPGLLNGNSQKRFYLPLLDPLTPGLLRFGRWQRHQPLTRNRFGIAEPRLPACRPVPLWSLDVLVIPLVAFDEKGGRLGMGGGFYDRSLAAINRWPRRPLLVGVGYRFQQQPKLPLEEWDIRLDMVLTD